MFKKAEATIITAEEKAAPGKAKNDCSMTGLSTRRRKFCRAYLISGCDARQALRAAGYKTTNDDGARKQVYQLFQSPGVKEYYSELVKRMEEREGLTLDFLYKTLREIIDICVPEFKEDSATQEEKAARAVWISENVSGCVKAIAEINKMQGNYAPAKTDNNNNNSNKNAEIEDIQALIKQFERDA